MRIFAKLMLMLYIPVSLSCTTSSHYSEWENPVATLKKLSPENISKFETSQSLKEFIGSNPKYLGARLLTNELLADIEIRKKFENYGYSPYIIADLNKDGRDEYAFVVLNQNTPTLLIIKKQ